MTAGDDLTFYATTAQVIPVLMIVVGFQTQGWKLRGWGRWIAFVEFSFCAGAMIDSLRFLHSGEPGRWSPTYQFTAIFVLVVTIAISLFPWAFGMKHPAADDPKHGEDPKRRKRKRG